MKAWLSCPLKFKFRYVDGIKSPTTPSLFLGKRVHAGLEFFYRHLQDGEHLTTGDVLRHMAEQWQDAVVAEGMFFDSADDEPALRQQAAALVDAYLDARDPDEGHPIAVEAPLRCPLIDPVGETDLGISLLGYVDLVLDSPVGLVIIDFKTAGRSSPPLEIVHELQLSCYAYALRQMFGRKEGELQIRSLIKTKTPKIETHQYPPRSDMHFRRLPHLGRGEPSRTLFTCQVQMSRSLRGLAADSYGLRVRFLTGHPAVHPAELRARRGSCREAHRSQM